MNDLVTYGEDSFFTLSGGGQLGLALLSLILWALAVLLVWRLARGPIRGAVLALVVFVLFVWLSPQIYYAYYFLIFDDLPVQIVIKSPPGPGYLLRLLTFTQEASLSRHGQGLLGWSLLLVGVGRGWRRAAL
ncbi:hypothetical protein [Jannaschia pohangensis]|uniref:Uncharacterized protein n=1 Tax=Jannaschia pohangensis TaxID=390807 RepID=A0A1I3U4V1_9RHOB|nr:hypothetical protein [Jannaschia pohangensis]SFJ78534.1 hypothetical protein SAMN04488095_3646 [Jannaschia pohangensis]